MDLPVIIGCWLFSQTTLPICKIELAKYKFLRNSLTHSFFSQAGGHFMHTLFILAITAVSGVWSAWQYNTGNWESLAPLLAENGFDTVFYCAAYGPETDIEGLRECVEACSENGI